MRIYLIGLPGVGKSTVGQTLAKELGCEYIDLDTYIEQQAMMFVDEIFDAYGEAHFRALESEALKELLTKDNLVIACGGGIVKDRHNKKLMSGLIIELTAPLAEINKRLEASNIVRPLLFSKSLETLAKERKELYEYFRDYEVINNDLLDSVKEIKRIVGDNNA